jgi:protein-tyrosine phosphatase
LIASWADRGALIQITAGSLLGDFGLSARTMAIDLVLSDFVALVATDAHDAHHRVPRLSAVIDLLATRVAKDYAKRVCLVNPMIIAAGQDLES